MLCTYAISDRNGEEIVVTFYEKELWEANQRDYRVEKVIKIKSDELMINTKREGYDNSFNSWIVKKDIVI